MNGLVSFDLLLLAAAAWTGALQVDGHLSVRDPIPVRAAAAPAVGPVTKADPCASLNASTLEAYRDLIGKALSAARVDASQNGTTGTYAVAAANARNLLQRTHDKATEMVRWNGSGGNRNPRVTIHSDGDQVKAYLRSILETLPEAAHWATISAVYHKSQRARDAFEETIAAISRGNELMGEAGRCFMTGYF